MNRNNFLDLYKSILTLFVLLYHLSICNAGFLAVCGFFTISGYLFATTINKHNFNLKQYYLKRLKTLYLPLLIVSFSCVFVFRYIVDIPWTSIKQETLSVILSYNNFFQISANSNYFIRSDASPFTHMWYISILIQIEFIMPIIICLIRKTKIKNSKKLLYLVTILSIICFIFIDYKYGMAVSYYHTLSRLFSFLIGQCAYYINYFNVENKPVYITLFLIIIIFLVNNLAQQYYVMLMILVSLLSGIFIVLSKDAYFDDYKIINKVTSISYFVYLIQYPVIYIIDNITDFLDAKRIILEAVLIIVLAVMFTYGLSKSKNKFRKYILIFMLVISSIGVYGYITCEDYNLQMLELKSQLETNKTILEQKQKEYLASIKDKQNLTLNNVVELDKAIENIDETVKNTKILFIGDSIMLGGSFNLDKYFSNYYCDAQGSRNGFLAYETLSGLLDAGIDAEYIVIHLGTNSGLELEEVESISSLIDNQKVFWLTVTNGWRKSQNPMLEEYCETHENNYLIDWYNYSLNQKQFFIADGLHLSSEGRDYYDQFIFDNLKEVIKQDLIDKKQEMIDKYNDENNNTISFYGNDILINIIDDIDSQYLCYGDSNYDFDSLYLKLKENKDNLLMSKIVFIILDRNIVITNEEINKIKELLKNNELYIFAYNKSVYDLDSILDKNCYIQDGINLNNLGKETLLNKINQIILENY